MSELTDLLRTDKGSSDLRDLLRKKECDPNEVLLAGFIEGEVGLEHGVIVTRKHDAYQYERNVFKKRRFRLWEKVENAPTISKNFYPALLVGLKMVSEGVLEEKPEKKSQKAKPKAKKKRGNSASDL